MNGLERSASFNQFVTPKAGNEYLAVDITLESNSNSGVSTSATYASIQDASGFIYTPSVVSKEPFLQSQLTLSAGAKLRGWVTFELPKSLTGLTLIYNPALDIQKFSVLLN